MNDYECLAYICRPIYLFWSGTLKWIVLLFILILAKRRARCPSFALLIALTFENYERRFFY